MSQLVRAVLIVAVATACGCESNGTTSARQVKPAVDAGPCAWASTDLPAPHELDQPLPYFPPDLPGSYECGGVPRVDGNGDVTMPIAGPSRGWLDVLRPDGGPFSGAAPQGTITPLSDGFLSVDCERYEGDEQGWLLVGYWSPESQSGWGSAQYEGCSPMLDASGGATTLTSDWPPHMGYHVRVRRFDSRAGLTGTIELFHFTPPCNAWAATDEDGDTLAIYGVPDSCGEVLQWFDAEGNALTVAVPTQDPRAGDLSTASLQPMIGGGFAVARDGRWVGVLENRKTETTAAPAWLTDDLAGATLELAPRHHGYIVHGVAASGPDSERVLLLGRDGESCGSLDVPAARGAWSVGADGSIAKSDQRPTGDGGSECAITIWPHVFH